MQDPWVAGKKFGSFLSNIFTQPFQYFQILNLVDSLSSWYKFIMNNPSNIMFANFNSTPHLGRRGVAPIILSFCNWSRLEVSVTLRPLNFRGKSSLESTTEEAGRWRCTQSVCTLLGIEIRFLGCPTHSLFPIVRESRNQNWIYPAVQLHHSVIWIMPLPITFLHAMPYNSYSWNSVII